MVNKIVTVVVVTKGASGCLKGCLESLRVQGYPGLEVIVIDNSLDRNFNQYIAGNSFI